MITLPQTRDPAARLVLICMAMVVAVLAINSPGPRSADAGERTSLAPAIILATEQPTASLPTARPEPPAALAIVEAAPPTMPPMPTEPPPPPAVVVVEPPIIQVIERVVEVPIYIQPSPPPPPPAITVQPAPEQAQALPGGGIIILEPTPGPGDPGFAESFEEPNQAAKCAFVGCL